MERKILSERDMTHWTKFSVGHSELSTFITKLNEKCKRTHDKHINSKYVVANPILNKVASLLEQLSQSTAEVEPALDKHQRFGNIAFRKWYDIMIECCDQHLQQLVSNEVLRNELLAYLTDSFGNRQRIDYGTGHELSFMIFLMGLTKCVLNTKDAGDELHSLENKTMLQEHEFDLVALFGFHYMPLCRKIQARYRLEPAGSHGVYSLDDFQFLPFLFGSAQLIDHPTIQTSTYPEKQVAEKYMDDYLFHAAIYCTHVMKKGPFAEHSNQLWNISAVEDWSKINRGLMRKYLNEVMGKFPIVQHLKFGQYILIWSK